MAVKYKQLLTIFSYENQQEIAEGLKRAFKEIPGLKREDLFIVGSPLVRPRLMNRCTYFQFSPDIEALELVSIQQVFAVMITKDIRQHRSDLVEPALDACLKELGLDCLDVST